MKKTITLIQLMFFVISVSSQTPIPGKVKVFFAGFDCVQATWDDALQLDGKGDEILLNINMTVADANGNTRMNSAYRSPTYGDATGAFPTRINTGSCLDLVGGAKGGIKNGDKYRCNNLIGEFDLSKNDVLSVIPVIFEWDQGGPEVVGDVSSVINSRINEFNKHIISIVNTSNGILSNMNPLTVSSISPSEFVLSSEINFSFGFDGIFETLAGKNGTRPIGIAGSKSKEIGAFLPNAGILPTPLLLKIINTDFGAGKGVIPVRYDEPATGNTRDNGIYIIWIKIEFIPNTAPAPAPSGTVQTTVQNPNVISRNNIDIIRPTTKSTSTNPSLASLIIGTWEGTRGTGSINNTNYYSLRFNSDNTIWLLSANEKGQIVTKGAYTVSGEKFDATYTLPNGTVAKLSGGLNNNSLAGTWVETNNNKVTNGKWVMIKK